MKAAVDKAEADIISGKIKVHDYMATTPARTESIRRSGGPMRQRGTRRA